MTFRLGRGVREHGMSFAGAPKRIARSPLRHEEDPARSRRAPVEAREP